MKRKRIWWMAGTAAFAISACTAAAAAFAANPIQLIVNGETLQPDVPPQIIDGRTMVPVRWIAEALGAEVKWDGDRRAVTVDTKTQNGHYENPYRYPRLPQEITSPDMLLQAYFAALAYASNLTHSQLEAAGGTLGMGQEPYRAAYNYWSAEWQKEHSYEDYLESWSGTASVELLKLYEAETENGEARFFVETKHLEAAGTKSLFGEFYYSGFFSAKKTEDGWRLTDGSLEPQNLAWALGGHQPWLADPILVAIVQGLGRPLDGEPTSEPRMIRHDDDFVTVIFTDEAGNVKGSAELVRLKEGTWKVISVE